MTAALLLAAAVTGQIYIGDDPPPGYTPAPRVLTPAEAALRGAPWGGDTPAAFVGLLNAERARLGAPPLVLDQRFAGTPDSPHYCSTTIRSYVAALDAFLHSPLHRPWLVRADLVAVGVSVRLDRSTGNNGVAVIGVVNRNGVLVVP